jgi:hypothetical protein
MLSSSLVLRYGAIALIWLALFPNASGAEAQTPSKAVETSTGDDTDRPILRRGGHSSAESSTSDELTAVSTRIAANVPGPAVAPGLMLPATGRVWALDIFEGKPDLIRLMYLPTSTDRHAVSNFAKANLAPFIAKMKTTVEIRGATASARLHEPMPAIFVRCSQRDDEDAALDPSTAETYTELVLVKLEVHGDKRLVSTMAFTQVTGKASRSEALVEVNREQVAGTAWQKITPRQSLAPGEYGLVALPKGQALFATRVFDFAIDPKAPRNSVLAPGPH